MTNKTDYYKILGVHPAATKDELKAAYRKAANNWHPDKYTGTNPVLKKEMTEMFQKINEAYSILSKNEGKKDAPNKSATTKKTSSTSKKKTNSSTKIYTEEDFFRLVEIMIKRKQKTATGEESGLWASYFINPGNDFEKTILKGLRDEISPKDWHTIYSSRNKDKYIHYMQKLSDKGFYKEARMLEKGQREAESFLRFDILLKIFLVLLIPFVLLSLVISFMPVFLWLTISVSVLLWVVIILNKVFMSMFSDKIFPEIGNKLWVPTFALFICLLGFLFSIRSAEENISKDNIKEILLAELLKTGELQKTTKFKFPKDTDYVHIPIKNPVAFVDHICKETGSSGSFFGDKTFHFTCRMDDGKTATASVSKNSSASYRYQFKQ